MWALLLAACWDTSSSRDARAPVVEFGVFFGGQVQERSEIPFVLDSTRQTQGFRIQLAEPAPHDVGVQWELEMPAPRVAGRGKTVAKLGEVTLRAGQSRLDQRLPFEPGDPLGLYNLRVILAGELVIDRAFEVYDRAARRRALQDPE